MVRRYLDSDLEKAAKCYMETFAEEPWNEEWSMELAMTRIRELMSGPISIGYVYEEDTHISGVMIGRKNTYLHGSEYFIDEFCIVPSSQGKGIGTKMINYAKEELGAMGYVGIVLNTEKGYPSELFYKKNGFVQKEDLIFMYLNF